MKTPRTFCCRIRCCVALVIIALGGVSSVGSQTSGSIDGRITNPATGGIVEGNVDEFIKFMPGVNIDNAGGNARDISLNGVPSIYVPVTLDGFGLASAVGGGSGGTSRGIGLDQVSINNLSRIEVAFSPTP